MSCQIKTQGIITRIDDVKYWEVHSSGALLIYTFIDPDHPKLIASFACGVWDSVTWESDGNE